MPSSVSSGIIRETSPNAMSLATEPSPRAPSEDESESIVDEITLHQGYKRIFQNHLSETLRHGTGHFSTSMGASIFPPCAYWTAEEKDSFFHALARHSALRPDLIAAEIGSKTVVDVCGYIALLRTGAQKSDMEVLLRSLPAALEMSDRWVAFEETQAVALIDAAAGWEVDQKGKDRKDTLRTFKERKGPVKGAMVNRTWDVRAEQTRSLQLYKERKAKLEKVWEKEDALDVLDAVDLQTLDTIVRKGTEEQEIRAVLDTAAASTTPQVQVKADDEFDLASLTPTERRRVKNRLYMRRKRAEATGNDFQESITRLKPGRKPKAAPKESAPPSGASSPEVQCLLLAMEGEESGPEDEPLGDEGGGVEGPGSKRKVAQRGMTRAEKAAAKFAKYGLDFGLLKEHELDLFHLRRLGGLMFAYSHGNLESIKYSVTRLLRAYLDEWLAIVVQHAVLAAEQERRAKEHTDVWKTNLDEIKVRHVEHALAILDCKHSKRGLLERLERCIDESESKEGEDMEGEDMEGEDRESEDMEGEDRESEDMEGEDREGEDMEGENMEGEDMEGEDMEGEDMEGEDMEGEDTEDNDLPEPWSCVAREVYPPLINHPCLLDAEFELDKKPIDDVMEPATRLEALIDAEEGKKLESMDVYNAKRHERMLWRLVGKEGEIKSDSEEGETSESGA